MGASIGDGEGVGAALGGFNGGRVIPFGGAVESCLGLAREPFVT